MEESVTNITELAKVAKPQFARRVCNVCNGSGKAPGLMGFMRTCSMCRGRKIGRFVLNRVGGWQYLPSWLETVDGAAYDTLVDTHGCIPTWAQIDALVYSDLDAAFHQSLREVTVLGKVRRLLKQAIAPPDALQGKK